VDEGLNVENLLAAWKLQDEVSDLSMKMLRAGIELGARSTFIALAKIYIAKNYEILQTDDFDLAVREGVERAIKEMDRRMNDVRGS